jgi:ribosomal protein S21
MDDLKVNLTKGEERTYKTGGFESMLRRFNRAVQNYGTLGELKKREYFVSPSDKRSRKRLNKKRGQKNEVQD